MININKYNYTKFIDRLSCHLRLKYYYGKPFRTIPGHNVILRLYKKIGKFPTKYRELDIYKLC